MIGSGLAGADPGFPQGAPRGGGQHTNLPNCMKSKEFGCPRGGGGAPRARPLNPPMVGM